MNYLKNFLFALSFLTLLHAVDGAPQAVAQGSTDSKTSDAMDEDNDKPSSRSGETETLPSHTTDELTLGDLRDSGIALNQIRQEAINIFLEATRSLCDSTTRRELIIPSSISEKDLEIATMINAFQTPRPKWLFYYVGTMEPIISMLTQDVHRAKSGVSKMLIPANTLDNMKPLWQEWTTGIAGINNELTDISKLVDNTELNNVALAKHALAMYKMTESLERTREKAFVIIRDASKHENSSEKVNLPDK